MGGSAGLTGRARRATARLVPVVAVLAALTTACAWVPAAGRTRRRGDAVRIVAPANRSQAPTDGTVPVDVALSSSVDPGTLHVYLETGPHAHGYTDVSGRFTVAAGHATATLTAADLQPGLSRLVVVARRRHSFARPERATSVFSWEPAIDDAAGARCDFLATAKCLFPFPNDYFTVPDPATPTGLRVHLDQASMPANSSGVHVDPTEWNRNDGFSPGSMIVTYVPGLDLGRTGAAPITDMGRSLSPTAPVVLIDADTGRRQLIWAELDANATSTRALIIRPGVNLREGHRYIVALRDLKDSEGATIQPTRAFRVYRDRSLTFDPLVEARRAHMEDLFRTLRRAGIGRHDLYLAWDFTVASQQDLSSRLLHIRDDAFASLHGGAPSFTVTSVQDGVDDDIARRVTGTFQVPLYLTGDGGPGSGFDYGGNPSPDALPVRNGTYTASFICNIPRSATTDGSDPVHPGRGVVYGHGLLGSNSEVNAGNVRAMAEEHDMVYCATNWIGFSSEDVGYAIQVLGDFSKFPEMADRTQQGFLDTLFLARLLKDPRGFASDPAFQAGADHTPVLVPNQVYYDGNSQGGILGGAVTAVSTEWTRAVLGVPGMNYSTLLRRSVDFQQFALVYEPAYPDELDRTLALSIVQMLWDRAEADGYAEHMTDHPYPGTPAHEVLLHEAFGDHQVANVTTEVEARTIGARLRVPALAPGRSPDVVPFFGIPPITSYPYRGSALVVWDSGNPAAPTTNTPPSGPAYGSDPHEKPRSQVSAREQKSAFLAPDGVVIDVCGTGQPCLAP